ncbi:hypothetical protein BDW22DRAFT_1356620 [Trametopsis cervina]|nr:hypothetical protein BDW22DRAFT_1356620 [Trametopsis cervina]
MHIRSSKNTSELPFDIIRIVFDHVVQSFPVQKYDTNHARNEYTKSEVALKQCFLAFSLVCRHWHVAAQPYAHRVFSIRFGRDTAASTPGLLDILRWLDTQPLLPPAVRHLRLIMVMNKTPWEPELGRCDPDLFYALLHRFPRLRTLELFDLVFDSAQLAAHVSKLTTAHVDTVAPIDLDTLLLAYGARRPLSAKLCVAWFGTVSTLLVRGSSALGLLVDAVLESFPAQLVAGAESPILKGVGELHAPGLTSANNSLGEFVRPAVRVLEELHLDLAPSLSPGCGTTPFNELQCMIVPQWELLLLQFGPHIDLGEMSCLRELVLGFPLLGTCWPVVLPIVDDLLSRRRAHVDDKDKMPPLRRVTLAPRGSLSVVEHGLEFAHISAVLAGVPTLERCTVDLRAILHGFSALQEQKLWFRKCLVELHEKGVLRFVV